MILVKNIKLNRKKNIQQKQRKVDSFINDESLSSSDSESLYHTALTNPRTSTNSTASKPMPVLDSIKRYIYVIFIYIDKDTEFDLYFLDFKQYVTLILKMKMINLK